LAINGENANPDTESENLEQNQAPIEYTERLNQALSGLSYDFIRDDLTGFDNRDIELGGVLFLVARSFADDCSNLFKELIKNQDAFNKAQLEFNEAQLGKHLDLLTCCIVLINDFFIKRYLGDDQVNRELIKCLRGLVFYLFQMNNELGWSLGGIQKIIESLAWIDDEFIFTDVIVANQQAIQQYWTNWLNDESRLHGENNTNHQIDQAIVDRILHLLQHIR